MSEAHSLVAALFGPDEIKISEWIIHVPEGTATEDIVAEVLQLATADESLDLPEEGMVYVALRPAGPDDMAALRRETGAMVH